MVLVLMLIGCGSLNGGDKDPGKVLPTDGDTTSLDNTPRVLLESPAAGSFVSVGSHDVDGLAVSVADPALGGTALAAPGGRFSTPMTLVPGMNTFEVTGARDDGLVLRDHSSVLAGETAAPQGKRSSAIQGFMSANALASLGPIIGAGIDPVALSSQLQALNPVVSTPQAEVNLEGVEFDPPIIELIPVTGAIDVVIHVPNFVLGIDATIVDALPFGIDLSLSPELQADEILVTTQVVVQADGQGNLEVTLGALQVDLVEFDLDTGILELVDWLFLDDDDLAEIIETQLAGMGSSLQPAIDSALAGLSGLETELDLLGTIIEIGPSFDDVVVDPAGIGVDIGMAIDADAPEPSVPGHLAFAPPPLATDSDLSLQISDDFMNRALLELWAGGALDIDLPLGAEDATVLFLFGGKSEGHLSMKADLPPVWIGKDGAGRMQLGEIHLTVDTPGGDYGDVVEVIMALDAAAEISVTSEAAGVVLSDAKITMRPAGESVGNDALIDFLPGMASAFGIGIGIVNELLTFPLVDLLGPGAVLPVLDFERDVSGLGTRLVLPVEDLVGLLTGTLTTPGTGTGTGTGGGYPYSGVVAVPGTSEVHDDDGVVADDNHEGWVCSRDDVEADGDNGTWYIDDRGVLIVRGTGHVIYAIDNAEVTLETPGNTVYADPGADIQDDDGTNTIIVIDPLQFDLSVAPQPGC